MTPKSALVSVFHKDGLKPIVKKLDELNVKIYSTGGTEKFIRDLGIEVVPVEDITSYPSILGGRVKTLHPKVFGGILNRRKEKNDVEETRRYEIPNLDIVVVDLYPFEKTLASGAPDAEIIEKIDIGGISLIRAAAKNFNDVLCISSMEDYAGFLELLSQNDGAISLESRKQFATKAFKVSSSYDRAILDYFNGNKTSSNFESLCDFAPMQKTPLCASSPLRETRLRYGENPHQKGWFYGDFEAMFDKLHGKELSYNNLMDVDAALNLMGEFKNERPTFAILKHNNACGLSQRGNLMEAYKDALAGDPVSAFGGILVSNTEIDPITAGEINQLFCEVVIAPSFSSDAMGILKQKKNRILLKQKTFDLPQTTFRSCLNGTLAQEKDTKTDSAEDLKQVTEKAPSQNEIDDLLFASKICKHTKSNTIVLAKNKQLFASGTGQTSRVDALRQAIEKALSFGFDLNGAVMASDAFFPFPDCVEIAHKTGIKAVIQPGGSVKDQLSIDYCDENNISMIMTGTRHFKH